MPMVETAEGAIAFIVRGTDGVPAIFVHGAGGSHRLWGPVIAALPKTGRYYAIDLPGHGRSPGAGRRTIAGYGAAVEAFLDSQGLERAVIIGHSMGGAIALWLALERPACVTGLGLVGTSGRLRVPAWLLSGIRAEPGQTIAQLVPLLYGAQVDPAARSAIERDLRSVAPEILEGDYLACAGFDVLDRLGEIAVAAAVVCGAGDRMAPPEESELLQRRLGNATLHLVEGAGHMVMLEDPDAVAGALARLLER
ncbi:MAG: alpha/beta hydrolase [Herpetosiphonaceae bacterium]|nr:MAG: alpha/beta hydrolase [Herpetosiphonaceae bacterium]